MATVTATRLLRVTLVITTTLKTLSIPAKVIHPVGRVKAKARTNITGRECPFTDRGNKTMKKLLTVLALIASVSSASATQAKWKEVPYWTVVGDASGPYCGAYSTYSNGKTIHISLGSDGWKLGIQGVKVTPGTQYTVGMATNKGAGAFVGVGVNENLVVFSDMSLDSIISLGMTPKLAISDLGVYPMRGSATAIMEIAKCYKAVTGRDA
jgi:hypothetical protein